MVRNGTLYDQLLDVSEDYLGPAAERFIERQIENHLEKDPKKLNKDDLKKLTQWIRLSLAVLTDDENIINEFIEKLERLARIGGKSSKMQKTVKLGV